MTTFVIHTDPGHAWVEVSWVDLKAVGLGPSSFSRYSYRRGNTFYLEEDCDASKFVAAWRAKFGRLPDFGNEHSNYDSFIRSLPSIRD